eukprot:5714187-Prymnesium_polylepis.1
MTTLASLRAPGSPVGPGVCLRTRHPEFPTPGLTGTLRLQEPRRRLYCSAREGRSRGGAAGSECPEGCRLRDELTQGS